MGNKNISAVFALSLLAASAWATNKPEPANSANSESLGVGYAQSSSRSSAEASAAAIGQGGEGGAATAIGAGGAGGDAQAVQGQIAEGGDGGSGTGGAAHNEGNHLSVSSSYEQKRQAPNVYAPAVYASGSCAYGWSAGISIPGGGISGGKAKADPACDRREVARVLSPLNPQLALKVLCADPIVAAVAHGTDCTYYAPPVVTTSPARAPDLSGYATREELDRAFKKSQSK